MRVLVTGASGFVGSVLCEALSRSGYLVRAAIRNEGSAQVTVSDKVVIGDIALVIDWSAALRDVDVVIHLAARAHVLHDSLANANLYHEANALGSQRLAEACAAAGVRRFIYLSSIKVNGEETTGRAFTALDVPHPNDAYGTSKWCAEKYLVEVSKRSGMETAIVRPPLVYGPGVRANFLRLLRWIDKGRVLPLGAIANKRSLVSIWNLCDLLMKLLQCPAAPGQVWLVSDGEDLSTPDLIRRVGRAMGRPTKLLPIPQGLIQLVGRLAGRQDEVARICGSLEVDIAATRRELGWSPPLTVDESLARTIDWYLSEGRPRGA
jgi:nucleoside-diphosphate-sugar epimerase